MLDVTPTTSTLRKIVVHGKDETCEGLSLVKHIDGRYDELDPSDLRGKGGGRGSEDMRLHTPR